MNHKLGMVAWLAESDGIPSPVQHLFDLSEYEAEAREIERMENTHDRLRHKAS